MSATTSSEPLGKEDLQKDKVIELRGRLSELEVQLSGEERQTRWYKGFAAATMLIVMFAFLRGLSTWWEAGSIVLALLGVAGLGGHIDGIYKIRGQIERCKSELSILEELPLSAKTDSASYFQNLVTINVSNLKEYYFLVKQHTNWSFRAAMSAGIVGFLLISIGLGFSYAQNARDSSVYIATGAGVITEFVSGVFFFLYNKTVRQL